MKGTNKPKERHIELMHFDTHGGLSQSEENEFM